jgi:hypothetical protein
MKRSNGRRRFVIVAIVVAVAAAGRHAVAEEQPDPGADAGPSLGRGGALVRERMRRLFAVRLKTDVGLDDAKVDEVLPKIESLERERTRIQRERVRLVRELRRGLREGMPDDQLQKRLDALDALGRDLEATTARSLGAIDRDLTVPQRVRLRFLVGAFRAEMARRIEEFRDGGRPGARRRPAPPD